MKTPVSILEVEEYLFSQTAAQVAQDNPPEKTAEHVRGSLRLHRFLVFTWLLQNGVSLPAELLADREHPPVGEQTPDKPVSP